VNESYTALNDSSPTIVTVHRFRHSCRNRQFLSPKQVAKRSKKQPIIIPLGLHQTPASCRHGGACKGDDSTLRRRVGQDASSAPGGGGPPTDATVVDAGTPPPEVIDVTDTDPAGVSSVRNAFAAARQEESDDDEELLEPSGLHCQVAV
jgi:hypothetical protein